MSRSFFTSDTDSILNNGSKAFSAQISADPQAFGLSVEQTDAYALLNAAWISAYTAVSTVGQRSKGLVQAKNDARTALCKMASNLAKIISASATVSDSQKIDLGINVRKRPTPMDAPGKPDQFSTTLSATGSLTIHWKCSNPRGSTGTMYQVYRRAGATGTLECIGITGNKTFVDMTIPAGATALMYQVQAIRSTRAGPRAQYNVNFGTGGNAMPIEEAMMKRAA